jgi:hypothetical protein
MALKKNRGICISLAVVVIACAMAIVCSYFSDEASTEITGKAPASHKREPGFKREEPEPFASRKIPETATVNTDSSAAAAIKNDHTILKPAPSGLLPLLALEKTYNERLTIVRSLGGTLDRNEKDTLFIYLNRDLLKDGTSRMQEHFLRNTIMDILVNQQNLTGVAEGLLNVYRNRNLDPVVRDYAIQHLGVLYEKADSRPRNLIKDGLFQATAEMEGTLAGTGLLALNRLAGLYEDISSEQLAQAALLAAGNERISDESRTTALQVCALMQLPDAAQIAADILSNSENTHLQISAIAALGYVGDADQIEILSSILSDDSRQRLHLPAQTALERIKSSNNLSTNSNKDS